MCVCARARARACVCVRARARVCVWQHRDSLKGGPGSGRTGGVEPGPALSCEAEIRRLGRRLARERGGAAGRRG